MDVERALGNPTLFEAQLAALDEEALRAALVALPLPVQRRIQALKKLQVSTLELEADFYRAIHDLELQFAPKFAELAKRRRDIVKGDAEPTDEEADFPLIGGIGSLEKELEQKASLEGTKTNGGEGGGDVGNGPKGIPEFWLHALKNVDLVAEMIEEQDEPLLAKLTDVELELMGKGKGSDDFLSFAIHFHFAPNDYFTNSTLSKTYRMKCAVDSNEPFAFDGPEIVLCTGTKIAWKSKEKNVTVKTIKKKQKHKMVKSTRFVTKEVKADSFFNFFEPPSAEEQSEPEKMDEETRELLNADFEIGQLLRDRLVPRAALYFTGEAQDDDEDYEDEDDEDEDDDDEEDESEEDDDHQPRQK